MRIAKFSDAEFADVDALNAFFASRPNSNPPGLVLIPAGQIRADGLEAGEWVLFTYQAWLRYVAQATSGRQDNEYVPRPGFPYCFFVDPATIRAIDLPIGEVERRFREAGVACSLGGQGWTELDSATADQVIAQLAGEA